MLIGLGLEEFAGLAARALEPKPEPEGIGLAHIHAPAVSVREQANVVVGRLKGSGTMTFRALASDAPDMMTRVARFLALLELFREGVVAFDQMTPLGELSIRWTGTEETEIEINDEFDGAPPEPAATMHREQDDDPEEQRVTTEILEDEQRRRARPSRCRWPSCGPRWRRC